MTDNKADRDMIRSVFPSAEEKGDIGISEEKYRDLVHTSLIEEALALREAEAQLGLWTLMRIYWPAMVFGLGLSLALVMEGMDAGMASSFRLFPRSLGETSTCTEILAEHDTG